MNGIAERCTPHGCCQWRALRELSPKRAPARAMALSKLSGDKESASSSASCATCSTWASPWPSASLRQRQHRAADGDAGAAAAAELLKADQEAEAALCRKLLASVTL